MRISDWSSDVCSSDLAGVSAEFGVVMLIYLKHALAELGPDPDTAQVEAAVRDGALLRVRPKAMTVAVIFAGLLPILLGSGTGSEVMSRIAAPMIGGMLTAPLLSRSEEHTSELQSLMRTSYAVFCLKKKTLNSTESRYIKLSQIVRHHTSITCIRNTATNPSTQKYTTYIFCKLQIIVITNL